MSDIDPAEFTEEVDRLLLEAIETVQAHSAKSEKLSEKEKLDAVFRAVHTIKGTAVFFNLSDLKKISHKIECLLVKFKQPDMNPDKKILNNILELLTGFYEAIQLFNTNTKKYNTLLEKVSARVDDVANEFGYPDYYEQDGSAQPETISSSIGKKIDSEMLENLKTYAANIESNAPDMFKTMKHYHDAVKIIEKHSSGSHAKIYMLSYALRVYTNFILKKKELSKDSLELFKNTSDLLISTISLELMDINNVSMDITDVVKKIKHSLAERGENTGFSINVPATNFAFNQFNNQQFSIRVQQGSLKQIFAKINDFETINQSLSEYGEALKKGDDTIAEKITGIYIELNHIHKDLKKLLSSLNKVPLIALYQRLQILINQVSKQLHKDIRLEYIGENIQLDKTILEHLKDCLSHLVRNSCDHGIESAEERIKYKKNPYGTIHIGAFETEGNIFIQFKDDGRGIDVEKVKQKLIKLGNISEKKINKMSRQDMINQILIPGLSTADKITYLSGRGVGLDVLNDYIKKLNGSVRIVSEKGDFTEFNIVVPI